MLSKYRPDIDGLRALAILPVLLFHAGFTSVSGGYVGVDIFFVISGFLITSILVKDIKENTYSIADFYERRIRRIFPALFTVVLFVLIVSPFALLPDEYSFLPKEVAGVLLFVSNIVSWRKSGYFSTDAEERPLLHTWSLGVEEQFYIFAPILLFFLLKKLKKSPELILLVLFIASFLISVFLTKPKPSAAFYLLPSRAWELLAGSLLAFNLFPATEKKAANELISLTGLVSILLAIFLFDAKTRFPGYAAALPVFGSMCIIYAAEKSLVGKILSLKPVVFIGLISYSLYLWHWPLIVFFRNWNLLDDIAGRWMVIAVSLIVAWFSWRFIEKPFRIRKAWPARKLYKASGWGLSLLVIVTATTFSQGGWTERFSEQTLRLIAAHKDFSPSRTSCHFDNGVPQVSQYCHFGAGKPTVAVWADSHGVELSRALGNNNVNLYEITYSGCPPNTNFQPDSRPSCIKHNTRALKFLEENKDISVVIMAARYEVYPDTIFDNINSAASRLIAHGKKVIIIGPVPTPERDVPASLARGGNPAFTFTSSAPDSIEKYIDAKVVRFMPTAMLCKNDQCNMLLHGKPLLFDDNHLSMSSADYLAGYLKEKIAASTHNPATPLYAENRL
ncbi:acyltransferase family protein [Erwinia typographi]|uniref:acyltransferase family protein n=1 Tax=Erwinia typographi TaxID=371042 RepID=UPI000A01FA8C|nr:acyltransferase family protein [Erwinia typographi]